MLADKSIRQDRIVQFVSKLFGSGELPRTKDPTHSRCVVRDQVTELTVGPPMIQVIFLLLLASVTTVTATTAMARSRHYGAPAPQNRCNASAAGPYVGYNPCNDPNAVFVGGTYAGSDPDPNIRAALMREFGRRRN